MSCMILFLAGMPPCPYPDIQCGNGECVHLFGFCNGYEDCADGTDEADCGMYK